MLQAVSAPPSSGQWFGFPRCCSLTGQGAEPSHCTHTHTHTDIYQEESNEFSLRDTLKRTPVISRKSPALLTVNNRINFINCNKDKLLRALIYNHTERGAPSPDEVLMCRGEKTRNTKNSVRLEPHYLTPRISAKKKKYIIWNSPDFATRINILAQDCSVSIRRRTRVERLQQPASKLPTLSGGKEEIMQYFNRSIKEMRRFVNVL